MLEDPIFWLFVAPGLLLGFYAQSRIKANYVRYSQIPTANGMTGAQVARHLLDTQGLQNVVVEQTPGILSDHYDPRKRTLRLSQEVYHSPSLSAAGIAAHETGHALQHAAGYFPMQIRSLIVPLVQASSKLAPWLFFGGILFDMPTVTWVGVIMFGSSTVLTLLTLPVELDASDRARRLLADQHIIEGEDQQNGIDGVLKSAAWTYFAGAVSAVGTLLYIGVVFFSRLRRRS